MAYHETATERVCLTAEEQIEVDVRGQAAHALGHERGEVWLARCGVETGDRQDAHGVGFAVGRPDPPARGRLGPS